VKLKDFKKYIDNVTEFIVPLSPKLRHTKSTAHRYGTALPVIRRMLCCNLRVGSGPAPTLSFFVTFAPYFVVQLDSLAPTRIAAGIFTVTVYS